MYPIGCACSAIASVPMLSHERDRAQDPFQEVVVVKSGFPEFLMIILWTHRGAGHASDVSCLLSSSRRASYRPSISIGGPTCGEPGVLGACLDEIGPDGKAYSTPKLSRP